MGNESCTGWYEYTEEQHALVAASSVRYHHSQPSHLVAVDLVSWVLVESQGSLYLSLNGGNFFDTTSRSLVETLHQAAFLPLTPCSCEFQGMLFFCLFLERMGHDVQ